MMRLTVLWSCSFNATGSLSGCHFIGFNLHIEVPRVQLPVIMKFWLIFAGNPCFLHLTKLIALIVAVCTYIILQPHLLLFYGGDATFIGVMGTGALLREEQHLLLWSQIRFIRCWWWLALLYYCSCFVLKELLVFPDRIGEVILGLLPQETTFQMTALGERWIKIWAGSRLGWRCGKRGAAQIGLWW